MGSILKHFCKYPGCTKVANTTWSLVPLCYHHRDIIADETNKYYEGKKMHTLDRLHYNKIRELTPFRTKRV